VTLEQARRLALALPEAAEEPHFDKWSFRVRGKIFATVPADGEHLHVFVDETLTDAVVTAKPTAFAQLWWGKQAVGVRVSLRAAGARAVAALLEQSWRRKAPRKLVAAFEATKAPPRRAVSRTRRGR
jgi:hypothetical protein